MKKNFLLIGFVISNLLCLGQTTLINSTGDGGFETGATVGANGWTSNGATNLWQIGNAPGGQTGVRCAYISNGGAGGTWTYTNSASKTSHLYRSINFPAGETSITLSFKWKCQGESGFDRLLVYTNAAGPASGTPASSTTTWGTAVLVGGPYNSNTIWQTVNITLPATLAGTTKNLIFTWQNDGSFGSNPPAAIDDISLISNLPPPPPANDLCANATTLPCGTVNLAGTTVNTSNIADPSGCASNYGVWYKFTGDGQSTTISSTATFDHEMVISSGACATLTNITCQDVGLSGGTETYTFTSTLAVTYYIYIAHYSTSSTTTGTFTISRSCVAAPVAPANDNCAGTISLTVNPDLTCTTTTSGTISAATASPDANTCGGTDDDDVWFSFVATGTTHYVDLLNVAGSTTDMYHAVYTGVCGSLTQLYCSDADNSVASGLTIGQTYYIRVYTWTSTGSQTSTFDVCITSNPPPITACSGNFYDSGGAGGIYSNDESYFQSYCSSVIGQCLIMTFSSFATESCCDELTIFNGPDMSSPVIGVYAGSTLPNGGTITANSGCLTIAWNSDFSTTGNGWAATISCGVCPPPTCSDGVQNGTETGVDCGGSCGACPVVGPCGNLTNNDFCSNPAVLTQGGGGWASSTSSIYSPDEPANISIFCGSIENNSWYVFTATAASETFDFTSVTNCIWGDGIQAEVYEVATDVNGCCTNFTSMSNCMNPAIATPGTVTATGLTIGNQYYLMVDGWAGDQCDFTVSNWSATGILPVTLIEFYGYNYQNGNKLIWTTQSEVNNDYFIIQKSANAKNFVDAGIVDGNGNSNNINIYSFIDDSPSTEVNYYRLKQIDFDGEHEYSKTIAIALKKTIEVTIYPNPSKNNLFFDVSESNDAVYTIVYTNVLGSISKEQIQITEGTNVYQVNEFVKLTAGIYFVQIFNENNEVIKTQKIVKE